MVEPYTAVSSGICLCRCYFNLIGKMFKADNHQARLIGYVFILLTYYGIATFVMFTFSRSFMSIFKDYIGCDGENQDACYGASIVFRTAAALFVFYFLTLLLMLPKDDFSYRVNRHCWLMKWTFPGVLFAAFCFVDNKYFELFAQIGKYVGIIYLMMQDFSFNEFFFQWSETWMQKAANNCCYAILYFVFAIGSFVGTIGLLGLNFYWHWKDGCGWNKVWLIINAVIVFLYIALTILNMSFKEQLRDDVNPVGTCLFSIYTTYYFYSGMASDTNKTCSNIFTNNYFVYSEIGVNIFMIIIVFSFLCMMRSIPFIKDNKEDEEELGTVAREVRYQRQMRGNGDGRGTEAYDKLEYRTYKYVWIFIMFTCLVLYFQNIVTNWGSVKLFNKLYLYSSDQAGYFIKILNGLFNSLLYMYVLLAPIIFPNRKFGSKRSQREASKKKPSFGGELRTAAPGPSPGFEKTTKPTIGTKNDAPGYQ